MILVETTDEPLVKDEELSEDVKGSADLVGEQVEEGNQGKAVETQEEPIDILSDVITDSPSRTKLVLATQQDKILKTIATLAKTEQEGYSESEGLMFRSRLNEHGEVVKQDFRHHCLSLAHERFGHRGRNKVYKDLSLHIYWPSMSVDVAQHVKSCDTSLLPFLHFYGAARNSQRANQSLTL